MRCESILGRSAKLFLVSWSVAAVTARMLYAKQTAPLQLRVFCDLLLLLLLSLPTLHEETLHHPP